MKKRIDSFPPRRALGTKNLLRSFLPLIFLSFSLPGTEFKVGLVLDRGGKDDKSWHLLIFPSWLEPRVEKFEGEGERISVAFNASNP